MHNLAKTALGMAASIGKQALSTLFPHDFEWYMVALELTDSQNNTIDYLAFPVMPDSITKTEPNRTNIKTCMSGVTVLTNPTFTPQEISIRGTFGRNFKILTSLSLSGRTSDKSVAAGKYDLYSITTDGKGNSKGLSFGKNSFNLSIKTGYGTLKILQAIADKSVGLDKDGKPLRLYFYNMALGESYLVTIPSGGVQYSQELSTNMLWNYSLSMTTLAPIEAVSNKEAWRKSGLISAGIQSGVNKLASSLTKGILS